MSINWVMLSPNGSPPYTPLANEQNLFTSPPRIGLSITTPKNTTSKQQPPFSLTHSSGIVYLTNRRIIYLPDKATDRLKSFAAPILNLHDSHVTAPFFGPNVWTAALQPVSGGGIPSPSIGVVELKLTFKEGGAFDFHTRYERVRERLLQAVEVSRMDGASGGDRSNGSRTGAMNGMDIDNVDLEDLPAYQERGDGPLLPPIVQQQPHQGRGRQQADQRDSVAMERHGKEGEEGANGHEGGSRDTFAPPDEPPPGYEETQLAGLEAEIERRRRSDGHGEDD